MAGFGSSLYKAIFRRSSTFTLAIVGSVFFFERGFDLVADAIFENANKGKLWKDIKHKYEK